LDLHAGMWLALEQRGIVPTENWGTSAGAIAAAVASAGHTAQYFRAVLLGLDEKALRRFRRFWKARLPWLDHFVDPAPIRAALTQFLMPTFDHLPLPATIFATDDERIQSVRFSDGDLVEAVMASMAIAGVFPPVHMMGRMFSDGGTTANLPVPTPAEAAAFDEVWLLIARPPVAYARRGENVFSRLLWNTSMLQEAQVTAAVSRAHDAHPRVFTLRPDCGTGASLLHFDHSLIGAAWRDTEQMLDKILGVEERVCRDV